MEEGTSAVPALRRAVAILDLLERSAHAPSAAEIARQLNIPKSTAHGLLSAMIELRMLARDDGGHMHLGPQLMRWTGAYLARADIVRDFQKLCQGSHALSAHALALSMLDRTEVVYLSCRDAAAPLGLTFKVGMRLPAPFTATGKAILSAMADSDVRQLFAEHWPERMTARSVGSLDELVAELELGRSRGFSVDDGQVRQGMICVGAPVLDFSGRVVGGIAVNLLSDEADGLGFDLIGGRINELAERLSQSLGFSRIPGLKVSTAAAE